MQVLLNLVVLVQLVAALAMIGLVLVQHGKGADMGASFGSGASGSLFGATGSANFLSRSTAVCATIFFVATLALAYFGNMRSSGGASSVLDRPMSASATAPSASAASAVVEIPGATTAPVGAPAKVVAASAAAAAASR
jgi:preprotein translocase subunit SecG